MPKSDPLFHAGHRERLKEKLLDDKLTSYEKLELLLTYAIPRRDVRPAARALIARFRSVYGVLHASIEDLQTVSGIGHNTALLIHLVHQLMLISHREQLSDGNVLADPNVTKEYCRKNLVGKCVEELHIMYLDTKFRLIDDETHSRGTIDQSEIDVFKDYENLKFVINNVHSSASIKVSAQKNGLKTKKT